MPALLPLHVHAEAVNADHIQHLDHEIQDNEKEGPDHHQQNDHESIHAHVELERLFDVAIGTGLDKDHPKLRRAFQIVADRLADRVLREAQEFLDKDTALAQRRQCPPVGPASTAADCVEDSILKAISDGVPETDKRLSEAKEIVRKLREADNSRKRMANREARLAKAAEQKAAQGAAAEPAKEEAT